MKIVAIIPARMGSSRFPGKIMKVVNGQPLIGHLLDRIERATLVSDVIVATSQLAENKIIYEYCRSRNITCFRGEEDDVLARMIGALDMLDTKIGVVVYGDCPLIDPMIIDQMIRFFNKNIDSYDFVGNDLSTTWPPGMEVEVFSVNALKHAHHQCEDPQIREHGTLFLRQNPQLYRLYNFEAPPEFQRPDLEIEIDLREDLLVIQNILNYFSGQPNFGLAQIIEYLDCHPEITGLNNNLPRRWKEYRLKS